MVGRAQVPRGCRGGDDLIEHLGAPLAPDLDDEPVLAAVDELGQDRSNGRPGHSGFGPVPIETQKQVPLGSEQATATTNAPARRPA